MNDNPAIKGLIELIEKRYGLEVLDSHYVLVDEKFKQYNMMLYVKLPKQMLDEFKRCYWQQYPFAFRFSAVKRMKEVRVDD